jgi:uncharacterized protein DUF3846
MEAKIYHEDGTVTEVVPENGTDFKLDELQKIVGGIVQLVPLGERVLACNEEGKINNICKPNHKATLEWDRVYGKGTDYMFGNILICDDEMIK